MESVTKLVKKMLFCLSFHKEKIINIFRVLYPVIEILMSYCFIIAVIILLVSTIRIHKQCENKRNYEGYIRRAFGKMAFFEKLYDYLTSMKTEKCIIVTAPWGQGKTFWIREFFKEYLRYRWDKVYTVSCFGIEGREQLTELLENEMYLEDSGSIDSILLASLEQIPIVGSFFSVIREHKYSIKKIPQNGIIIFEDVERVVGHCSNNETEKEAQMLNVLAGFVHELVDRHHNKVILVCNKAVISAKVYKECLYKKLACEEVTFSEEGALQDIAKDCLREKKISGEQIRQLSELIEEYAADIAQIRNIAKIRNYRLFQKVFTSQANFYKYARITKKEIVVDFLFSYLFAEIMKEKNIEEKALEKDALKETKVLKDYMKVKEPILFSELYRILKQRTQGSNVSKWWSCICYFPIDCYWVGEQALNQYAYETRGIAREGVLLIKTPEELKNRTRASLWKAARKADKQYIDNALEQEKAEETMSNLITIYCYERYMEKEKIGKFLLNECIEIKGEEFENYIRFNAEMYDNERIWIQSDIEKIKDGKRMGELLKAEKETENEEELKKIKREKMELVLKSYK